MNDEPSAAFDRENAFLLYTTFLGDVTKTAHALNISAVSLLKMVDEEGWDTKVAPILALKKSTRPGDLERALNRALNYVQAYKMRMFIARVIHRVSGMTEEEFNEYLFQGPLDKEGNVTRKLTTRALADLASAMEKAQALTYLALSDTSQDRSKRKEGDDDLDLSAGDIHAQISAGLAAVRASDTPRARLLDAQLEQADAIVKEATKPTSSYDL